MPHLFAHQNTRQHDFFNTIPVQSALRSTPTRASILLSQRPVSSSFSFFFSQAPRERAAVEAAAAAAMEVRSDLIFVFPALGFVFV
jgi:hypothetical protein